MLTETIHYSNADGHKKRRIRTVLEKNKWTDEVALAIWNACKLEHAFMFSNHHITRDSVSGTLHGKYTTCLLVL